MDEVARSVSDRGELVLRMREDGSLELRANGVFVMDTVETSTEVALATRALALHHDPREVLVGGLGLGFTLEAILADERVYRVTVVELEAALVTWMSEGTIPFGPSLLSDPRVVVETADVAHYLRVAPPSHYDLVLLDVDNGPGYLVHEANGDLYREPLLEECRRVTRPGGSTVIWSASEAPELLTAMEAVFGRWRAEAVAFPVELQGREEQYWLYVGHV
ncbi:spermidine synthase [Nocardioides sp. Kera G14]|uniref:spermidine synthase n=1 Tax=Nocardioides sp. Kera G14 TaxID=2884264 RepID=UPI001D10FF6A|nr:hypothetical protein [Nocardioides sp. Kera G14]UDY22910.1 hypothetical protein LH076_12640 [Nocardioides sp. Kera G14]